MKKIAKLPIKKQWFDMIISGEKTEEYRAITLYWKKRLGFKLGFAEPTHIELRNGYGRSVPSATFEVVSIKTGIGKPEWGAEPGVVYFVIEIGNRM